MNTATRKSTWQSALRELWETPGILENVLRKLGLEPRDRGRYWALKCPRCGRREAYCYDGESGAPWVYCSRGNHCAYSASVFWLLTEERGGQRAAFELLREFADLRGAAAAGRGPETPPRCRPPPYEVRRLLGECLGVTKDAEVALWLHEARGLDPVAVEHSGLAVALPSRGSYVPGWARFKGRPWTASAHRILVPMFSCNGKVESVHARAITKTEPSDKAASPAGYAVGGLVMAESLARRMLAGEADAVEMVRRVGLIVAEGVPDYLTWATHWSDAAEEAPGVIGILAGSWCEEIAARVPDGTLVIVRTHQDPAGGKYGQRISETLVARCDVRRLRIEHRPQVEGATP